MQDKNPGKNRKYYVIELLRLIACIGVYNGHFFSIALQSENGIRLCDAINKTTLGKTIVVYSIAGDISVLFFFALSGFLLSYDLYRNGKQITFRKLLQKELYLILPSLLIVTIGALIAFLKRELWNAEGFSLTELFRDFRRIVIGGWQEDSYPYYSYQLWYINNVILCRLFLSLILMLFKDKFILRYLLYAACGLAFWKYSLRMDIFIMGVAAGEIVALILKKKESLSRAERVGCILMAVLPLIAVPLVYHEGHRKTVNIWGGGLLFVICVSAIVLAYEYKCFGGRFRVSDRMKRMFDPLVRNSFTIYLVHVLVIGSAAKAYEAVRKYCGDAPLYMILLCVLYFMLVVLAAELLRRIMGLPARIRKRINSKGNEK
ncbi:MAG: acyltransferase [Lachnospiraceae bacterium]|nr:acyltransferase [Lachnospiraceae bacterium]